MQSILQRPVVEGGMAKLYDTGVVGYQPCGMTHDKYAQGMRTLRDATPHDNEIIFTYFNTNNLRAGDDH